MATLFHPTSEAHQKFSGIARDVREKDNIAIITRHGIPCFALLPADEINNAIDYIVAGTREVNNEWGKYIKLAQQGKTVYIKYNNKVALQLININQDEINDIIIAYSKDLQNQHNEELKVDNVNKLKSARDLLNERKSLRIKDNSKG